MKLGAFLALSLVVSALGIEPFKPDEAAKHVGKVMTIAGKVGSVKEMKSGAIYINLGKAHPEQDFTAYVRPENAKIVKEKLPNIVAGDVVSVTGKITLHKDKPQIEVTNGDQIKKQVTEPPKEQPQEQP